MKGAVKSGSRNRNAEIAARHHVTTINPLRFADFFNFAKQNPWFACIFGKQNPWIRYVSSLPAD
jgi:hypothetical protein